MAGQASKLRQKDRDARWTVKFTKAKPQADGTMPPVDIAIPAFGYQNHISIDARHGLIRKWLATDAPLTLQSGLQSCPDMGPIKHDRLYFSRRGCKQSSSRARQD